MDPSWPDGAWIPEDSQCHHERMDELAQCLRTWRDGLTPETVDRRLTPGVQRILDRLSDVPVLVTDAAWTIVAANPLAHALLGHVEGNIVRRHFSGEPSRVRREPEDDRRFEQEAVADLHDALGRHPHDERLLELIADLRAASPLFAELWEQRPVARWCVGLQTF